MPSPSRELPPAESIRCDGVGGAGLAEDGALAEQPLRPAATIATIPAHIIRTDMPAGLTTVSVGSHLDGSQDGQLRRMVPRPGGSIATIAPLLS